MCREDNFNILYTLYACMHGPTENHVYTNTVFVILSTLLLYCCSTNAHIQCVDVSLSTTNSIIEIISGPSKRSCSLSLSPFFDTLTNIHIHSFVSLLTSEAACMCIACKNLNTAPKGKERKKGAKQFV